MNSLKHLPHTVLQSLDCYTVCIVMLLVLYQLNRGIFIYCNTVCTVALLAPYLTNKGYYVKISCNVK